MNYLIFTKPADILSCGQGSLWREKHLREAINVGDLKGGRMHYMKFSRRKVVNH